MKNTISYISHLTLLVLTFVLASHTQAQNKGKITGTVFDSQTGEVLIGVNVSIEGTLIGSATDIDGNFVIVNVVPGTYTLKASYVSYSDKRIEGVEVKAGETVKLNFELSPETFGLEEITVTAEAVKNSDAALLSIQRKAIGMQDGISAQMISNSGSSDAAGAMSKVVGASVVGGKYVFVRGLGDRYTNTQLNGMELPTSDPDKKSFQLDLFPSALLENIVTLKTFTPDKPGNFSGGLVDVNTKGMPDNFYLTLSTKQGYNTRATFKDVLLGETSSTDWLGFDDGYRASPEIVKIRNNSDFPSNSRARLNYDASLSLDSIAKAFNPTFLPQYRQVGPDQSHSISFGNRHNVSKNVKIGYTANYSYSMTHSFYDDGKNSRFELLGNVADTFELNPNQDFIDVKGTQNVDWGFLGSVGMILFNENKINFSYLNTQSGSNMGRYLYGYWEQFNSNNIDFRSQVNQFVQRDLESFQLSGKHKLTNLGNIQIDWNTAYQANGQEQPDLRFIANEARYVFDSDGAVIDTLLGNPASQFPRPARFFRNLNEDKYAGTIDITVPLKIMDTNLNIKFGGLYEKTARDFQERRFEYLQGTNFDLNTFETEFDYLNQVGVIGYDTLRNGKLRANIANYIVSATTDRSSYDSKQDIRAAYFMFDWQILSNFKLVTGARYEDTFLETISRDSTLQDSDRIGRIDLADILPSVIGIINIGETMNLRLAYSNTLARPTFRELAPYVSFDFVGDNLFRGNAQLQRSIITNYDIRWEMYPNPGELISFSGFYKSIANPIERVLRFDIAEKAESIQNVKNGQVYGVELELRKNLGSWVPVLSHFTLTTNFTLVNSIVNIPEAELVQMRETDDNPPTTRPLTGQSPYIANIDLMYSNQYQGIVSTLSFNKFGDRLNRVAQGSAPNIFERSYSTLNYSISKNMGKNFSIKFAANNLLDPQIKFTQIYNDKEYIFQQYRLGRTFSIGLKYDFR